mmetsp:Transcript_26360/g.40821  ORF Transcript_26360/g.40821 Transcript_26360/m.40821 type:complete len:340 (+) Transcript_26360:37-1056(+)|eukprot:CAMPEP_0196811356 /NCGR_PEP_ID=MMETSP1362-20130617/17094_1 /TAXON_ID=163516 /ORGANISM="Leptocylindrus danicus, Strain CCMP1856" /LENGTH=339 /DNA_ID=CAMNT_0042186637 /DNA_START=32 /DNA_END=1051 /DNA_ORIENTATION=+
MGSGASKLTRCDAAPMAPPLPSIDAGEQLKPAPESPPPVTSVENDSIAEAAANATAITNPGPLDMATMEFKRLVSLDAHDGFRVDISKQLSPYMLVMHSFWLGTSALQSTNKTYTFVTQVGDEHGVLVARLDPSRGSLDGRVHRALGPAMGKLQIVASKEGGQNDQLLGELDFGGETWTGNIKYGSMGGIVFGCNYFQSVTPSVALGGEGMYVAANGAMMSSYTAKYTGKDFLACINFNMGQQMMTCHYKKNITPKRVAVGAELSFSPMSLESQVLLGAEFNLTRSKMAMCIDGDGRLQSTLEAKLGMAPGSPTLSFAGELDHLNDSMRFGFGLNIGGG